MYSKHVAVLFTAPIRKHRAPTTRSGSQEQTATQIPALIMGSTGTLLLDDTPIFYAVALAGAGGGGGS